MKKLFIFLTMLVVGIVSSWAEVNFKADTPYLMIQQHSGKSINMNALDTNATLSDTWSLIYFTSSDGGYIISDGTNKISAEGWHAYVRNSRSSVWTISEVEGKANQYKLYQNTSENPGFLGSDEYSEGKPCFCDINESHASTIFIIIEANVYVKLKELLTIPALYSSTDINALITMIKGTALSADQQESYLEAIYKSAEGKKFYALSNFSGTTKYINVGSDTATGTNTSLTTDAVMTVEYAESGKYYLKGNNGYYICTPSSTNNAAPNTTADKSSAGKYYIGNYAKTTNDNVYFTTGFSTNGNDHQALHFINHTKGLTGWSYNPDASQWKISFLSDEEYTSLSSAAQETLNYTLTDANGATYSGTITGTLGVNPTFTGCSGYSLSNSEWDISDKTFTADVTFPFTISSNEVTNWTYIGSYSSSNFYWYVTSPSATVINAYYQSAPTNQSGDIERYEWAIIPSCTNGAFTFTLKNASTGTYITSTSTAKEHDSRVETNPVVSLSGTGTAFTYDSDRQWCLPTKCIDQSTEKSLYLSQNSSASTNPQVQYIGTWTSHNGTKVQYYNPDNFPTLISDLTTTRNTVSSYTIGTRVGEFYETTPGTMETALSNANGIINGTAYATAATITTYKTALNSAKNGLNLNIPTSGPIFMRIRSSQGEKGYMTTANAGGRATFTSKTDASTIYLWAEDKKLISYGNGLAYAEVYQPQADGANGKVFNIVSAVSGNFGQYSIYSTYSGSQGDVYLYSTGSGNADRNTYSSNFFQQNSFTLEPLEALPVTFNSAALGYATFNSPVPLQIPSNTTAYICQVGVKEVEGKTVNTLTFYQITNITTKDNAGNDVPTIPANTPVLLYNSAVASSNVTVNFPITSLEYDMDPTYIEGSFGTLAAESFDDDKDVWTDSEDNEWDIYSLRVNSTQSKVGFYKKTTGTTLAGFKAWLKTQHTDDARNFVISFDGEGDPTGIVEALGLQNDNVEIYDLNGRKLSSYKKGINIVNGKKVMIQ